MRLLYDKLIVGERLGSVPDEAPTVPLQQDLARQQKQLRMRPEACERILDLDLRKPNDLERSRLLHRLEMLSIPWGQIVETTGRKKGTFHEFWQLQWQPEFAVQAVEASVWGGTVLDAAGAYASETARRSTALPELTELVGRVLLADLPVAVPVVMHRLEGLAAVSGDAKEMMAAVPPLASALRYGNVRKTDTRMVGHVLDGLLKRIFIGLPAACSSLNDDAADDMLEAIISVDGTVRLLQNEDYLTGWHDTLAGLAGMEGLHGFVGGRCCRILLGASAMGAEECARRLGLELSYSVDPARGAAWIEGFLRGGGMVLLHDDRIWEVVDSWVTSLPNAAFTCVLPLVRRTFATFSSPERRQMLEKAEHKTRGGGAIPALGFPELDRERAESVLPLVRRLLGLDTKAK
jgi:hypothetical protein